MRASEREQAAGLYAEMPAATISRAGGDSGDAGGEVLGRVGGVVVVGKSNAEEESCGT